MITVLMATYQGRQYLEQQLDPGSDCAGKDPDLR